MVFTYNRFIDITKVQHYNFTLEDLQYKILLLPWRGTIQFEAYKSFYRSQYA